MPALAKKKEKIFYPDWKNLMLFFSILLALTGIFFYLWIVFKFILFLIPGIILLFIVVVWIHNFITGMPKIVLKNKAIRLLYFKIEYDLAPQNLYRLEYSPAGVLIYRFKLNSKKFVITPEKYEKSDLLYAEFDRLFKEQKKTIEIIDMRRNSSTGKQIP